MARYDKNLEADAARPLSVPQLLELLDQQPCGGSQRTDAVACFLAGAEGWEQAAEQLGGAFSDCEPQPVDDQTRRVNR